MVFWKKFFISIFCAALFWLCSVAVAQAADGTIAVEERKSATLSRGESVCYTFIPSENGEYVLWVNQGDAMYNLSWGIFEEGKDGGPECTRSLQEEYEAGVYTLKAGKRYDVKVWCSEGREITRAFGISRLGSGGSLSFAKETLEGYVGWKGSVRLMLSDLASVGGGISWSSSDPAVVSVVPDSLTSAELTYLSAGSVMITASNGSNSCSCMITVLDPGRMREGVTTYLTDPKEGGYDFTFTPEVSGTYLIYTNRSIPIGMNIRNMKHHLFYDAWQGCSVDLKGGTTYTFSIFVTGSVETDHIGKLAVNVLRVEGEVTAPSGCNLGDFRTIAANSRGELRILEPEVEYRKISDDEYYMGTICIEEDGAYYLHVRGEDAAVVFSLKCDGDLVWPTEECFGPDGGIERVYRLSAGKLYDVICGSEEQNEYTIMFSKESVYASDSGRTDEGGEDGTGKILVERENFAEVAANCPEESVLTVCSAENSASMLLNREAFLMAANRGLTVEVVNPTGLITLDVQTMRTIGLFLRTRMSM